jgi:HflK protein
MIDFLLQVGQQTWWILKEAAVFLLFGYALAGVLAVLVPARTLTRFLGTGKVRSVLWAAALGVPLPLCSCGVLPTALGLRKQGATNGATVAFLVATPETGVDSISLSYALMDPVITVFRPLAAMVTAISAGLATNFFGEPGRSNERAPDADPAASAPDLCCQHDHDDGHHDHEHGHGHAAGLLGAEPAGPAAPPLQTARDIYAYAFRELLDETSYWLILGIVLSGVVAAALPPSFFAQYLGGGFVSMLVMLAIGVPIYTCASSSTPIAAALVLKGLNPGAALVFLLAGPATNLGSLTVLLKFLGARVVAIYLASIVVVSLCAGYALNWVYAAWQLDPAATFGAATAIIPEPVKIGAAVLLIGLLLVSLRRAHVPGEWLWLRDRIAALTGIGITARRLQVGALTAALLLYLGSGLFSVQPGEIGIRQRFGRIVAPDLTPGLHYRLPWPFESHRIVPTDLVRRAEFGFRSAAAADLGAKTRARDLLTVGGPSNPVPNAIKTTGFWFEKQSVPEESFLLTGDGNFIDIRFSVQYRVKDPVAFAYRMAEPEALVRSLTLAALRGVVATGSIDAVYTTDRGAIERRVQRGVQARLDGYGAGIELLSVRLLYVHPPAEVHDAFRDVASAQEDKLRTINRAETFAVEKVNRAQGEAAAKVEEAKALEDERVRHAEGDAAGFDLKVEAYQRAPELTRFRLQLETIEVVLPGVQKFVRPGADQLKDLDLWLLEPFGAGRK